MCRCEDSIRCKANPCRRHNGVCLLLWQTPQRSMPATLAASQGSRHIPCAVAKIQSVAKRTLADGTTECACYCGRRHNGACLLLWQTALRVERKFAFSIPNQKMVFLGHQACSNRARPILKRTHLRLFLPFGFLSFLPFFLFPFLQPYQHLFVRHTSRRYIFKPLLIVVHGPP
jgi:hypothetical protein